MIAEYFIYIRIASQVLLTFVIKGWACMADVYTEAMVLKGRKRSVIVPSTETDSVNSLH